MMVSALLLLIVLEAGVDDGVDAVVVGAIVVQMNRDVTVVLKKESVVISFRY